MGRRIISSLALALFLSVSLTSSARAQEIVTLKDGTTLVGKIEKEQGGRITFRTEGGIVIEFFASDVKKIEHSSGETIGGRYRHVDPNHTRLLWAPTARTLKAGSGYFADYYVLFPSLAYAVTNRFTFYGAMSIVPGVDLDKQVFFFAPKLGVVQKRNFALATGVMIVKIPEEDIVPGIIYGVNTWGNEDKGLTVGLGWGWAREEEEWKTMDSPVIMIGGEHRISSGVKLLTENWWLPGIEDVREHPVLSLGIRFFGGHLAADLGFFHVVGADMEGFPFIPWVDFVYNF
jgi:hypothetical protein